MSPQNSGAKKPGTGSSMHSRWRSEPNGSPNHSIATNPQHTMCSVIVLSAIAIYLSVPTTILCGTMLPIAYVGFLLLQRSKAYLGADRQQGVGGLVATGGLLVAMLVIVVSMVAKYAG